MAKIAVISALVTLPVSLVAILDYAGFSFATQELLGILMVLIGLGFLFLDILILGYFKEYARLALAGNDVLPDLEVIFEDASGAKEVLLLVLAFFSPAILSTVLGFLFFFGIPRLVGFAYLSHSLIAITFFTLGPFYVVLSLPVFPVCFFRFVEGNELRWALQIKGIMEDLSSMGQRYWEVLLTLLAVLLAGGALILFLGSIISMSFLGILGGEIFFVLASSVLICYLICLTIKLEALLFLEVPFKR